MTSVQPRPFADLTPDVVLAALEALGLRCDGRLLALNSYENRVYRVGQEDGPPLVAKFYRPGRWSDEAIVEEHDFTAELVAEELDVVAPMAIAGQTLHHHGNYRVAVFASVGGRAPEPGDRQTLLRLGQLIGRLHMVGARQPFQHRPELTIERMGRESATWLLDNQWLPEHLVEPFRQVSRHVLDAVTTLWQQAGDPPSLRLHGDLHMGNILVREQGLSVVDLDDCLNGPAVQDLWMLVSGEGDDLRRQVGWLLEGYSVFRDADLRQWHLMEALRSLRLLQHNAWIARRWHDPAFPAAFPWFAGHQHWESLVGQLHEQLAAMQDPVPLF
ncbi:MAG: serine/threonine protein kinase [Xanthomonadales bacterium]|nr:serine/threonine protein kinase [Xanthomonadales bacterium]